MKRLGLKLRTFGSAVRKIHNWPTAVALRLRRDLRDTRTLRFRNGLTVSCRSGTEDWNVVSELLLLNGYQSAFEYLRGLKGSPRVLDLGANIGMFSLRAALEHPRALLDAYEPAPPTIELFKKNLMANPHLRDRITLHEFGAGSTARNARFFYDEAKPQSAGIYYAQAGAFEVQIKRFADIVTAIGQPIALAKIDVEGAEFEIVKDTPAHVWNEIGAVSIELHHSLDKAFQPDDLLDVLRQRGYAIAREEFGPSSYFLTRS